MNAEERLVMALVTLFGVGLVLIAVGLGTTPRAAATVCGIVLCVATTVILRGGRP